MPRLFLAAAVGAALTLLLIATPGAPPPVAASSSDIVISQIYGGGGRSTAASSTYRNDYVELFNRGSASVDLTSWSAQYQATTNSPWTVVNLSGVLPAGGYLLIAGETSTARPFPLPPLVPSPDLPSSLQINPGRGKVALVTGQLALGCGQAAGDCIGNPLVRDFVGWGEAGEGQPAANNYEASRAPGFEVNQVLMRAAAGCSDSDNNLADFSVASPQPRNSAAALHVCPLLSTRTPTPSPTVAATPTVAGAARATATPTSGPTRVPTSIPTPSPAILRFVVVLDGSPDPTAGAYTADGAVYGAGSVGSAGVPADGVAPLGRYHAFGLRTGPGVGEVAATHLVSFAGGELSARGAAPLVVPITGGNGAYAGARGELRLRPLGEDGRAFAVEAIVSRGQAVPLATVTSRAAATATSVAMTPFLSLTPTLVSTGPGWIVQLTPAPDDQLLAGDLYTARDLQDDGAMRPSAHPVGAYRAWILPDGDGASTQTVSVQLGTAGEVVATGLALGGGMPITGGSGDYRNARGVLMLTPLGDNSNLLAVALRPGAEPLRVTVTPSPTSTVEPTA